MFSQEEKDAIFEIFMENLNIPKAIALGSVDTMYSRLVGCYVDKNLFRFIVKLLDKPINPVFECMSLSPEVLFNNAYKSTIYVLRDSLKWIISKEKADFNGFLYTTSVESDSTIIVELQRINNE